MAYLDKGRVWVDYLDRVNRTINSFSTLNHTCESTIKIMHLIDSMLFNEVSKQWGRKQLPNLQAYVIVFYKRNIGYLQSSHALTSIGFIDPSSNLNRTVFETLLREYLFIVDPKEVQEYCQVMGKPNENKYHQEKGVGYMRRKLYSSNVSNQLKQLYGELCIYSHPDIRGSAVGYPQYPEKAINDELKTNLLLMYGNIQVLAECFLSFFDTNLKVLVKTTMAKIATETHYMLSLEPDKEPYASKIQIKKDNFLKVLS